MNSSTNTKPFYNSPIPDDWVVMKGVDISEKITKGSSPNWQGFQYQDEGVLFVTSENVRDGFLDISEPKYLPIAFNDKLKNSILQKGDILINIVGASIGRSCIYNIDKVANTNQAVCILRPKQSVIREFVSYFLQLPKSIVKLLDTQSDSARPNLTLEDIRNFHFLLPPVHEQKAIAYILSLMDTVINKNNLVVAKKELQKKWLMENLLTGKKRLKGFEKEKWKEVKFGDVTNNFSRRNKNLLDAKIYSVTNTNGFVLQSDHFEREVAGADLTNYKIIKKNEFAYNPARINVGSIAYFENDVGVISSLYVCFSTKDVILDYFLLQFLQLEHTKYRIENLGEGGVRVYLWYDLIAKIKINLPSIKEQTAIATVLQAAEKEIQLLKAKTEKLRDKKKGLMQILLTGKKRFKNIVNEK